MSRTFDEDLAAWSQGDAAAGDRLYASAYDELKTIASRSLRAYAHGDQMHTTMLVNECYLKLAGSAAPTSSRQHFLALCARAMRQLIVDTARRHLAEKRGPGEAFHVTLGDADALSAPAGLGPEAITALDQALADLDRRDPRLARIAECRIFSGMDTAEIATILGVTERTVQRDWLRIKALLTVLVAP